MTRPTRIPNKHNKQGQMGSAYVRGTMYDVRLRNSRALRGEAEQKQHGIFYATTGRG